MFQSWREHIWRWFHLWLRLITFGGRSAHLAYLVHKSGHETSIIICDLNRLHGSVLNFPWLLNLSCSNLIWKSTYPDEIIFYTDVAQHAFMIFVSLSDMMCYKLFFMHSTCALCFGKMCYRHVWLVNGCDVIWFMMIRLSPFADDSDKDHNGTHLYICLVSANSRVFAPKTIILTFNLLNNHRHYVWYAFSHLSGR